MKLIFHIRYIINRFGTISKTILHDERVKRTQLSREETIVCVCESSRKKYNQAATCMSHVTFNEHVVLILLIIHSIIQYCLMKSLMYQSSSQT